MFKNIQKITLSTFNSKDKYDNLDYRDTNIVDMIEKYLNVDRNNDNPYDYVIGGSVRFPYHNRKSDDLDLFIYINNESEFLRLMDLLQLPYSHRSPYITGDRFVQTSILNRDIDLTFLFNKDEFDKLVEDFDKVEEFLHNNEPVCNILKRLHNTTGFDKYLAVRGIVNNEDMNILVNNIYGRKIGFHWDY